MTYPLCTASGLRGVCSRYPNTTTRTRPLGHSCRCSTRLSPAPCVFLANHKWTPRTETVASVLDSSVLVSIVSGQFRPHYCTGMPAWRVKCELSSMSALLHVYHHAVSRRRRFRQKLHIPAHIYAKKIAREP